MFDETYIHTAEDRTSQNRIILFCDVERPMRIGAMTAVNRWVSNHLVKASASQNEEGDKVGAINRFFSPIYRSHALGQSFKARNYKGYYAAKYTVVALTAALIVISVFV